MMLAAIPCDTGSSFSDLCLWIQDRDPSGVLGPIASRLLAPVIVFVIIVVCGRLIRRLFARTPALARDPQVRTLVHNVITALMYVFALLAALVAAGLSISVLLTFGGLTSLAVGLAFQDVLRNLLAGIFLLVEQPFKIGDWITVDTYSGAVQTIQLRTTALRTADGRLAIVPNLACFSHAVINHSAFDHRRFTVSLRVARQKNLAEVLPRAAELLGKNRSLAKNPAPAVSAQLDGEEFVIHCQYWLDYRAYDSDEVAADVAASLAELGMKP